MKRLALALFAFGIAANAAADIAIFTGGRTLKVEAYTAGDETIELVMAGGGKITVSLDRIERIIDDEIVPAAVVAQEIMKEEGGGAFPKRDWQFAKDRYPLFNSRYDHLIYEAAKKHNVDAALVSAVIKAESDFQPRIVSHKGARGLMQLMPATAKRFGVQNSFDPQQNINGGTKYLAWLLKKFDNNADLAVAAYNAGEGNVGKYRGIPPFRETINYVKKISKNFRETKPAVARVAITTSTLR